MAVRAVSLSRLQQPSELAFGTGVCVDGPAESGTRLLGLLPCPLLRPVGDLVQGIKAAAFTGKRAELCIGLLPLEAASWWSRTFCSCSARMDSGSASSPSSRSFLNWVRVRRAVSWRDLASVAAFSSCSRSSSHSPSTAFSVRMRSASLPSRNAEAIARCLRATVVPSTWSSPTVAVPRLAVGTAMSSWTKPPALSSPGLRVVTGKTRSAAEGSLRFLKETRPREVRPDRVACHRTPPAQKITWTRSHFLTCGMTVAEDRNSAYSNASSAVDFPDLVGPTKNVTGPLNSRQNH